jgi:cell division protease FtsH
MKVNAYVLAAALSLQSAAAFAPLSFHGTRTQQSSAPLYMALEAPPAATTEAPIVRTNPGNGPVTVRYSEFLKLVNGDKIEKVTFSADGTQLLGVDADGTRLAIEALPNDPELLTQLTTHKVDVTVLPTQEANGLGELAQSLIFPLALFAGLFFLSRRGGGAGGGMGGPGNPMGFGKSKAEIQMVPDTGVTFDEVAGCDGAKLELAEVVDFLKQPEAYTKNGCQIPRGVILDGPPGTGKTLLAKAVAGEAGVPFISISGSEFVEMFVGVGASRVRDIFGQAKKNAPCIIFIDEIDAVGRQRGAGYAGGNDEREQTVNQILVEMDGFDGNPGVITIAATNRVDILDQALLRPGRFDRKVTVDLPDFKGRARILGVHSRGKPLEPDVDLEAISRRTPGFSGAQLENLMNEAAISAARANRSTIGWEQIDSAVDRIMVGLEKKGGNPQLKQKELVAYHEAGHAIVGALVPDYDQVQKITIIPRSNGAGGLTFFAPQESRLESGMYSRQYLESQLAVALGGRLAEEIIYGEDFVTTGASNDIQQVANIATRMVRTVSCCSLRPGRMCFKIGSV